MYGFSTEILGEKKKWIFLSVSRNIRSARDTFLKARGWVFVADLQVLSIDYDTAIIKTETGQFRQLVTRPIFEKSETGIHHLLVADEIVMMTL